MQTGDIAERKAFYPSGRPLPEAEHGFYTSSFAEAKEIPQWMAYRRTPGREVKKFHRDGTPVSLLTAMLGRFHADPLLSMSPDGSAYDGSGYDTGHLCPAESMEFDRQALADSFLTSNAMPQTPALNRGPWRTLEAQEGELAKSGATLNIVCGPVFLTDPPRRLASGVAIPDMCFKVVAEPSTKRLASYIMPNTEHPESSLETHYVSIAKVAHLTSLNFPAFAGFADDPRLLDPKPKLFRLDSDNSIQIEDLLNGEYVLLKDYLWNPADADYPDARIRIPAGFTTDFGSIPKLAQNIYPPIGTFRDPDFLGHDWIYATQYFEWLGVAYKVLSSDACRAECDWRLLCSLQASGDSWASRNTIWSAVKVGGGSVWSAHTTESIGAARALLKGAP